MIIKLNKQLIIENVVDYNQDLSNQLVEKINKYIPVVQEAPVPLDEGFKQLQKINGSITFPDSVGAPETPDYLYN